MNDTVSNAPNAASYVPAYTNIFTQRTPPLEDRENSSSEIRCICGYDDDDGFTIQCDHCDKWQHGSCLKIGPKDVPDTWVCPFCRHEGPIDVKYAQETQKKRKEQELKNHKKKPTTSSRRKDASTSSHSKSEHINDKSDRKPASPKDQSSKPRSRKPNHHNLPDTVFSPVHTSPSENGAGGEADIESESEVPPSVYMTEYSPIVNNAPVSAEVEHKLKGMATELVYAQHQNQPEQIRCKQFTRESYSHFSSAPVCVRRLSGSSRLSAVGAPINYITLETHRQAGTLVMEYIGLVGFQATYVNDPINQYKTIRHPKPFVAFHPDLPVYIDARRCGSEARFIRHSCRPNVSLGTVVIDSSEIRFGLFAIEDIEVGAELTISWEWDATLKKPLDKTDNTSTEALKFYSWAETAVSNLGECACADKKACLLERHDESVTTSAAKRSKKAGNKRRRIPSVDLTNATKETSPEYSDERNNRRSSSTSSRDKPASRDLTPSGHFQDGIVSANNVDHEHSAREARKLKEQISLIDKLSNQDPQRKRVKRPSSGVLPHPVSLHMDDKLSEKLPIVSQLSNGDSHGSPVSASPSPGLDEKIANQGTSLKATSQYSEACTQTEPSSLPCYPSKLVLTRKKRILAAFRTQQANLEKVLKSSLSIVKEEPASMDVKVAQDEDTLMSGVKSESESSALTSDGGIQTGNPNIVKQFRHPSPQRQDQTSIANTGFKSPPPFKNTPLKNGSSHTEMHVQMPPTPMFPNAPTTPALCNTSSYSDTVMGGYLAQSPSTLMPSITAPLISQTTDSPIVTPTPAKKKMSLSEYGKRRKADISAAERDKGRTVTATTVLATPDEGSSTSNASTSSEVTGAESGVNGEAESSSVTATNKDTIPMDLDPTPTLPGPVSVGDEMHEISST